MMISQEKKKVYSFALTSHTNDGVNFLTPQICPFALSGLTCRLSLFCVCFPFQILDEFKKDSSVFILGWGTSSGLWLFRVAEPVIGALGGPPSPASGSGRVASVGGHWGRGSAYPGIGHAHPVAWIHRNSSNRVCGVLAGVVGGGPKVL